MKSGIRLTLGVNNIFDEEPPLAPTFNDDFGVNLYETYDPWGRYIFAGVQFSFKYSFFFTIGGPFGFRLFLGPLPIAAEKGVLRTGP